MNATDTRCGPALMWIAASSARGRCAPLFWPKSVSLHRRADFEQRDALARSPTRRPCSLMFIVSIEKRPKMPPSGSLCIETLIT
jgi:hypothetical protein